jgi:hypothetical protein
MAVDKHGTEIHKGDTVEFVYGGDRFETEVDQLAVSDTGLDTVTASVTVTVPAGFVRVVQKADKPKPEKALESPKQSSSKKTT